MIPGPLQKQIQKLIVKTLLDSPVFVGAIKKGHQVISDFSDGLREGMIAPPSDQSQASRSQPEASSSRQPPRWQADEARATRQAEQARRTDFAASRPAQPRPARPTPHQHEYQPPPKDSKAEQLHDELGEMLKRLREGGGRS